MAENYLVDVYTGEFFHRNDFLIVQIEEDGVNAFVAMTPNQRMEFAANKGIRIPKLYPKGGEQ